MQQEQTLRPQPGKQELAMNIDCDVVIYGGAAGSGKTFLELIHPLKYALDDPNYRAVFFRRNTRMLRNPGGIWDTSRQLYQRFNPKTTDLKHRFECGSELSFCHMEHEANAYDHKGAQYSAIYFDELDQFTEFQFTYLMSRLRSDAKNKSYVMGTCNPDADSWLLGWVEWWLDKEGYPDPDKVGIKRYYYMVQGKPKFFDTEEEAIACYPHLANLVNPNTGETVHVPPKTFTFIGGTIYDNEAVIKSNPGYLADLNSLPEIERARQLLGNWYVRPMGSQLFQRDWVPLVDSIPKKGIKVRSWDLASSEPSTSYRNPDYAASVRMTKDSDGYYYIETGTRFRKRPGERDNLILTTAKQDSKEVKVTIPRDPGSGGLSAALDLSKKISGEGFVCKVIPTTTKTKTSRFEPFSSACQNGLVRIVKTGWDSSDLEAFLSELESFTGDRRGHDDWVDACADCFNFLNKTRYIPPMKLSHSLKTNSFSI